MGRLTKDVETRYTQGESPIAVSRFTLAVDRKGKNNEADFINCIAFGKQGEFAEKYLRKGMKIALEGHIQTGSYEKDGRKVYTTEVVVDAHYFCESKGQGEEKPRPSTDSDGFVDFPDSPDEELPFN